MTKDKKVEQSIIKKFRKEIWSKFISGIKQYQLIKEGDSIAVCMSGGKDSMLLAKCMQELKKHGNVNFDIKFLVMDPGYNTINRQAIEENAKLLNIPITIVESQIFDIVASVDESPCYLCARMRRGYLYNNAKQMGCNKIALGHHFDDVIETILLSMLYGGEIKTMMPKLHSQNFEGMELIRPMYHIKEESIIAWKNYNALKFINCACRFTENCMIDDGSDGSKRQEMKLLIKKFRKTSPFIESNIFRSVENINLDTIIGYRSKGIRYNFLDTYDN